MKLKAKIASADVGDGMLYVVFDLGHGQKTAPTAITILSSDKKLEGCGQNILTSICRHAGVQALNGAEQIVGAVVDVQVKRVACGVGICDVFVVVGVA